LTPILTAAICDLVANTKAELIRMLNFLNDRNLSGTIGQHSGPDAVCKPLRDAESEWGFSGKFEPGKSVLSPGQIDQWQGVLSDRTNVSTYQELPELMGQLNFEFLPALHPAG